LKGAPLGLAPGRLAGEVCKYEHSSLLGTFVNYGNKKFYKNCARLEGLSQKILASKV